MSYVRSYVTHVWRSHVTIRATHSRLFIWAARVWMSHMMRHVTHVWMRHVTSHVTHLRRPGPSDWLGYAWVMVHVILHTNHWVISRVMSYIQGSLSMWAARVCMNQGTCHITHEWMSHHESCHTFKALHLGGSGMHESRNESCHICMHEMYHDSRYTFEALHLGASDMYESCHKSAGTNTHTYNYPHSLPPCISSCLPLHGYIDM